MTPLRIVLANDARKRLLKIDQSLPAIGRKIEHLLRKLPDQPYCGNKLQGTSEEIRRIRVGDYRIIYQLFVSEGLIHVLYIGPRGGAYK
ncbi:MAG: type II toxin-antitoxin system RelE/ParE family toxin [Candidatus Omnitrophica bacterium]|nr:type II toxin-antitoxin system RelE/ParE family toxin [Candidatus Omnitrophota bacterium]